jgi:hypothetical protein
MVVEHWGIGRNVLRSFRSRLPVYMLESTVPAAIAESSVADERSPRYRTAKTKDRRRPVAAGAGVQVSGKKVALATGMRPWPVYDWSTSESRGTHRDGVLGLT